MQAKLETAAQAQNLKSFLDLVAPDRHTFVSTNLTQQFLGDQAGPWLIEANQGQLQIRRTDIPDATRETTFPTALARINLHDEAVLLGMSDHYLDCLFAEAESEDENAMRDLVAKKEKELAAALLKDLSARDQTGQLTRLLSPIKGARYENKELNQELKAAIGSRRATINLFCTSIF